MPAKTRTTPAPVLEPAAPDLLAQELRKRRARNIAIGAMLGVLVLLFYVVTIVKLGPGVLNRPL